MKIYIITLTTLYDNGDNDCVLLAAFKNKEDARKELLKLYNEEITEQNFTKEIYSKEISDNRFCVIYDEYYNDATIGQIEEMELQ